MNRFEQHCVSMQCQGETLLLHPQGVIYWPAQNILFAADVHVGKEHCFGRAGIPIPGGISEATLSSLFSLALTAGSTRLIVLGDFMHSAPLPDESWLSSLRQLLDTHPAITLEIVVGNHDKPQGQTFIDNRVLWHQRTLLIPPYVLKHEPGSDERGFVLAGHLHPAWRLKKNRRTSLKAPAFWFTSKYAVLPAFGEFTGGVVVDANSKTDSIYMIGQDCVVNIPLSKSAKKP